MIFEARTKANKGCANSGNLDSWRLSRRTKHLSAGVVDEIHPNGAGRYKRDVREATKYIETAIIVDKAMFEKRNGSTRAEVIHDAIQVANIADLVGIPTQIPRNEIPYGIISVFPHLEHTRIRGVYRDMGQESSSHRWQQGHQQGHLEFQ